MWGKKRESVGLNLPWVDPMHLEVTVALWDLFINLAYPPLVVCIFKNYILKLEKNINLRI